MVGQRAASLMGISRARLTQLAERDLVPFVRHQDGTRLVRRAQLKTIGSARAFRWGRQEALRPAGEV